MNISKFRTTNSKSVTLHSYTAKDRQCEFKELEQIFASENELQINLTAEQEKLNLSDRDIEFVLQSTGASFVSARKALKAANNDLSEAVLIALDRISLNRELVQKLALDYAQVRGLFEEWPLRKLSTPTINIDDKKVEQCQLLWRMRSLTKSENMDEVCKLADELVPDWKILSPTLYFQILCKKLIDHIRNNETEAAITLAKTQLAPLAKHDEEAQKQLKETFVWLILPIVSKDTNLTDFPLHLQSHRKITDAFNISGSLCSLIDNSTGNEWPLLARIVQYLLYAHGEYFKLQMCDDRVSPLFKLQDLKTLESHFQHPQPKDFMEIDKPKESNDSKADSSNDDERTIDEAWVATLMDAMGFSRIEAVSLLREYDSLEDVFAMLLP